MRRNYLGVLKIDFFDISDRPVIEKTFEGSSLFIALLCLGGFIYEILSTNIHWGFALINLGVALLF